MHVFVTYDYAMMFMIYDLMYVMLWMDDMYANVMNGFTLFFSIFPCDIPSRCNMYVWMHFYIICLCYGCNE